MRPRPTNARGFTLIELMVTLALVAILMAVAVPSLTTFQRNAQLTSFSNTMLASINAARGEAMKRGRSAVVVPINGTDWSSGWIVFVDVNRNQVYDATSDPMVLTQPAPPSYLVITANGTAAASPPYIIEVKRNDVTGTVQLTQTRRIKIASTGRVRVCTPISSTDAQCSASASVL
jgi:type IV fimbrial biogenesis protein FimT